MPSISEISFNGIDLCDPPESDQIEISLFGPGYGESALLHVGDNSWLLVDSCINPISKEPSPLEYFDKIGINPSKAIKLVVASHWHDDHIRGLAGVYRKCVTAEFVISAALRSTEFLTFVYALGRRSLIETSGVHEFYEVMEILKERLSAASPKFAISDRLIWRKSVSPTGASLPCEVHSLSPSDESMKLALKEIGNLLPRERQPKIRAVAKRPNHVAVVLWIRIGQICILMGSDLENTKDPGTGWSVIINSQTRPEGKACVFKIPHHSSKSADDPSVWTRMLEQDPISILTPFMLGNLVLPTKSDANRICGNTKNAYSSAKIVSKRPKKKAKTVERTIRETAKNIKQVNPSTGHIRLRTKDLQPLVTWNIDLFGDALPLEELYSQQ